MSKCARQRSEPRNRTDCQRYLFSFLPLSVYCHWPKMESLSCVSQISKLPLLDNRTPVWQSCLPVPRSFLMDKNIFHIRQNLAHHSTCWRAFMTLWWAPPAVKRDSLTHKFSPPCDLGAIQADNVLSLKPCDAMGRAEFTGWPSELPPKTQFIKDNEESALNERVVEILAAL